MRTSFPSLFSTYQRATTLWAKTFVDLLPFLLLWMLCQILLEYFFPLQDQISMPFFALLFSDMAITALFFGVIINGLYQRYQAIPFDFMGSFKIGFKRFLPTYLAYAIVTLPLLLVLLAFSGLLYFGKLLPLHWVMTLLSMQHVIILLAAVMSLALAVLFFMAGVLIVIFKQHVLVALKRSVQLVKQYWMDTLLIIVLFGIIAAFASLLLAELNIPYIKGITTLVLSSFYPALMIIHYSDLETASISTHGSKPM
ncbi:MAG: hypothetical protein AB7I18_07115 [Candidatus Berkiella sp.]